MQTESQEVPPFLLPRAIPKDKASKLRMVSHAEAMIAAAMDDSEREFSWPPLINQALRVLTAKQRKYVITLASGKNHYNAYRASYDVTEGRSDHLIYPDIWALNQVPKVSHAIDLLETWLDRKWLLDAVEVKDHVSALMYEQTITGDTSAARIKAGEILLRMHGLLIDKREVIHRDANEMDEQSAIFRSILADVGLSNVLDAEYVQVSQQLAEPSVRPCCVLSKLMAKVSDVMVGDGDGI